MSNGFDDYLGRLAIMRKENQLLRGIVIDLTTALSNIFEVMPDDVRNLPQVRRSKEICLDVARSLEESKNESHSDRPDSPQDH